MNTGIDIFIAIVAGLMGSIATYLILTDQERKDFTKMKNDIQAIKESAHDAECFSKNAIGYYTELSKTVKQNRDDLDELIPNFTNLKHWAYGYVQYMPGRSKNEQTKADADKAV